MSNFKVAKEKRNKTWPFIKSANKMSFLDDRVNISHNLFDLVGSTAFSSFEGKMPNKIGNLLDRARFNIDIDLKNDYGINFDFGKNDAMLKFTKDF